MGLLAALLAAALGADPGILAAAPAAPTPAPAPEEPAPLSVRQRTLLVLRVLVYDRNLRSRAPEDVVVAVLYRPGDPASERERDEVTAALARLADEVVAGGRPIRGVAVPCASPAALDEWLATLRPAAAWLCAALAPQAAEIGRVTAARKVLSAAGSRAAVEAGIAVGVVPGPRRAAVLVNAGQARAEGADLDAALLGLAEIVGTKPAK